MIKQGRYVVFHSSGEPLSLETRELPELKEGEVLVQNEYTTLCRSDLNTYSGKREEKCPTILGHEIVGRIVGTYSAVAFEDLRGRLLKPGQRVTWGIYASDPESPMSKRGIPQKATGLFKYGHERLTERSAFHGGLASHTILRQFTPIIAIDESIPLPVAALINCSVATVAGAIRLAGEVCGQRVVVSGSGMLGLVACAMLRTEGAGEIIAVDINEARLKKALQFGADKGILPDQIGEYRKSAGKVIELSGAKSAMEGSLEWLTIGGTAVWVGGTYPQGTLHINGESFIRNLLTVRGLHNYNADDLIRAVGFIEGHHHRFPFLELIRDFKTLESAEAAFSYALEKNPFRAGLNLQVPDL